MWFSSLCEDSSNRRELRADRLRASLHRPEERDFFTTAKSALAGNVRDREPST